MPRPALTPVDPPGISKTQILYDPRKRDIPYLDRQVEVIAHEAESVDTISEPLDPLLEQEVEASPISAIEENGLPCVASEGDMIKGAWIMHSRFTSHGAILNN